MIFPGKQESKKKRTQPSSSSSSLRTAKTHIHHHKSRVTMTLFSRRRPFFLTILLLVILSSSCSSSSSTNGGSGSGGGGTFSLGIRDSFMIAHSFHNHAAFGPAGGLHGATYTVDVEFITTNDGLQETVNWVMDIGFASSILQKVLQRYHLKNLDDIFCNGEFTTTEFMCRQIHQDLCQKLLQQHQQQEGNDGSTSSASFQGELCVKLWESHKAWASYRASTTTTTTD
jgi:6-pyruvoyltetrahydropterin/6-carboxytetrahydropterin synthase